MLIAGTVLIRILCPDHSGVSVTTPSVGGSFLQNGRGRRLCRREQRRRSAPRIAPHALCFGVLPLMYARCKGYAVCCPHTPLLRAVKMNQLSPRELAVLHGLARGDPNRKIARDLGIKESTVRNHIQIVFRKIGVQNRTQAAMWAFVQLPTKTP
jgi:DNA-binding CsgD family transcriptional regulator